MPRTSPPRMQDWEEKDGENQDKRRKKSVELEAKPDETMDEAMSVGDPNVSSSNNEGEVKDEEMTTAEESSPPDRNSLMRDHLKDCDFVKDVKRSEKKSLLNTMVNNFYVDEGDGDREQLDEETTTDSQKHLTIDLAKFVTTGKKEPYVKPPTNTSGLRLASQNYKFDQELTHTLDIEAFLERLKEVVRWHEKPEDRDQYLAPLLPVVQSSGTGKSRLLYEARNRLRHQGHPCRSILLTDQDPEVVKNDLLFTERQSEISHTYDRVFKVAIESIPDRERAGGLRAFVLNQFEAACKTLEKKNVENKERRPDENHVFLFFDEAQHLTVDKGFLIRALRWILREIPTKRASIKPFKITVVLAATDLSLTDSFPETGGDTRFLHYSNSYYDGGQKLYSPFFLLRTQGCFASGGRDTSFNASKDGPTESTTEYEAMIPHSRPLFYLLHTEKKLGNDQEFDIALKIVLGKGTTWRDNERSCLSVLATRVQMGVTSTDVVSDLVAKGYAHLTYFQNKSKVDTGIPSRASFSFLPDPVCARIAMILTDDACRIKMEADTSGSPRYTPSIRGIKKSEIVNMMGRIFSTGLCLPAIGDVGEIAISLYLLFCGDVLRQKQTHLRLRSFHVHKFTTSFLLMSVAGWILFGMEGYLLRVIQRRSKCLHLETIR